MAFDRDKILQVAQKYIDKRKYDRAILEYQKVVEHEPNDARTLLRIGDLQARLGTHAEAIATYDRVAVYYASRGFSLKAVAVLKQISELIERHAPQLADQYGHVAPKLAQLYTDLGLTNDALATYDAVARRLQSRGRDRDAVEIIRRMVAVERSNALPYLRLAEALCRVSRIDEAVEHFWSAAQLLTQQGRPDDALKVLERILHFRQDVRVARVAAELYLAKGSREAGLSALSRLQLCFESDPRDLETLGLLARAFEVIGQPSKGVEVYKEMVRIAGETGQRDLHHRYVQHLLELAPRDDQVRALAAVHGVKPSERPMGAVASERPMGAVPHSSIPPQSLTEDDLEFIDDASAGPSAPPAAARARQGAASEASSPELGPLVSDAQRKALVDAEAFRALRMYQKAATTLRRALGSAPHSLELRAALQQVLLDMGDRQGAIDQMLSVAQHYANRGSLSAAEAELHQVLELSPEHPTALALLEQLDTRNKDRRRGGMRSQPKASPGQPRQEGSGSNNTGEHEAFELVARASSAAAAAGEEPEGADGGADGGDEREAESADEPLSAYELEDDDLITVMPPVAALVANPAAKPAQAPVTRADPAAPADGPLPQFSLDSGLHAAPEAPVAARAEAGRAARTELRSDPVASQAPPSHRESIRAALDEAQFFSARGLYQDASLILLDRLEQYPNDPELMAAAAALEPKLSTESGTRDVGQLSGTKGGDREDHGFDDNADTVASSPLPPDGVGPSAEARGTRGKELVVQFSADGTTRKGPIIDAEAELDLVEALDPPKQQIDVDEVFAKFKQGVKAQVSDSDSATHYDLGVAYKEMGLLADAAREFEMASRDPKRECNCLAMMGMMYRERGELDRAAEAYVRGLSAQHKTVSQEVSLYYDLGTVYEMKNDVDEAIYYYQRITRRDPTYRDVSQRLAALLPRSRRFSQPARAINDDQDFDRSFDDLYKRD